MAFTVPNEASASYTDQAEIDSVDLAIITAGFNGTAVISGCAVTAQSTPDDTVAVASGSVRIHGSTQAVSAGNVNVLSGSANADGTTSSAADANYFRYDLIVANGSGQLGVLHGTVPAPAWPDYSVNPVFPTFDSTANVVLAAILVPPTAASITGIATSQIVRKDLTLSINLAHDASHAMSGSNHTGDAVMSQLPQGSAFSVYGNMTSSTADVTANTVLYTQTTFAKAGVQTTGTGTFRWYNDTGRTLTFASVRISLGTAPTGTTSTPITGATFVVDVNKDGTSIWASTQANRATIIPATNANTGNFTAFDTTTIANASYLTVDVDFIGSTVAGSDLTVQIWMKG